MKLVRVVASLAVLYVIGALFFSSQESAAQQPWSWPEKSKNLKVLPKDTGPDRLRAVMTGYTRALGVRCSHCHVGKEGEPLSTYDFASDKNEHKEIARGMMRMTDSINADLARIVPAGHHERLSVGCITCHRGVARPRTLGDALAATYDAAGADSTVHRYRSLRARYYGTGAYDFTEGALAEVARRALEKREHAAAITLLRFNAEQFPESGSAQGGLAEAHLAAGDTASAIAALERAVQLDPKNERLARTLERLKAR